ncbi:translation initiation factor IF-3 [Thalassotalea agarivorans]|uniref:Translation initiation factor IF-3 n=1 Tax=Thalassotalea agarivorans TaxID=349064 RepID=A0A1I0EQU4_THASX|nr:translation initiation factor IF-3 [Thalassotalea agarivorans]SET47687.1 bacterial translation initiation factor 3 (bIF-3) [Thalassotalea agarivorans]
MEEQTIKGQRGGQKEPAHRLNGAITAQEVRLIGVDGEALGVVSLNEAMDVADDAGVDLVEISPTAKPPVCKAMDYGKFLYEKAKEQKEQRKKQKQIQVKEIKFRPGTDEGDYQVKLRNLRRFLEGGDKVKVTLRFRGREMAHQELGIELLTRVKGDLEDLAQVESFPKRAEGRQMVMVLAPTKR